MHSSHCLEHRLNAEQAMLLQFAKKQLLIPEVASIVNQFFFELGIAVDQTLSSAMAQIEVIVQKKY